MTKAVSVGYGGIKFERDRFIPLLTVRNLILLSYDAAAKNKTDAQEECQKRFFEFGWTVYLATCSSSAVRVTPVQVLLVECEQVNFFLKKISKICASMISEIPENEIVSLNRIKHLEFAGMTKTEMESASLLELSQVNEDSNSTQNRLQEATLNNENKEMASDVSVKHEKLISERTIRPMNLWDTIYTDLRYILCGNTTALISISVSTIYLQDDYAISIGMSVLDLRTRRADSVPDSYLFCTCSNIMNRGIRAHISRLTGKFEYGTTIFTPLEACQQHIQTLFDKYKNILVLAGYNTRLDLELLREHDFEIPNTHMFDLKDLWAAKIEDQWWDSLQNILNTLEIARIDCDTNAGYHAYKVLQALTILADAV
ncbi:hypothetical protein V1512DRAFT_251626 [Lipomyces arxii]|uniref:uncharacterized protein n=1 Tax=Lipomyces arxii TaxID=56418 RepID=UPI0034CE075A